MDLFVVKSKQVKLYNGDVDIKDPTPSTDETDVQGSLTQGSLQYHHSSLIQSFPKLTPHLASSFAMVSSKAVSNKISSTSKQSLKRTSCSASQRIFKSVSIPDLAELPHPNELFGYKRTPGKVKRRPAMSSVEQHIQELHTKMAKLSNDSAKSHDPDSKQTANGFPDKKRRHSLENDEITKNPKQTAIELEKVQNSPIFTFKFHQYLEE